MKKGIAYFKKNGFKKAVKRTKYFLTERNSYKRLLAASALTETQMEEQRRTVFACGPKISILVPMYHTPLPFFRELIDCICAQTYANWELCLADGTGKETEASAYAKERAAGDARIVYKMLSSNDGISENTNQALMMATGEYVALMDHDDVITPDALFCLVKAINDNPLADSVYSDEDKLDMEGKKLFEPHFKPDYNIDYLRCCNYICHMFMTRTEIARKVGGFRKVFDGAQDFDFIFRCTEQSRCVAHVPRVLYHWRCHVNSTAAVPESKLYAYEAGVNSIREHFKRCNIAMTADMGVSFGYYSNHPAFTEKPQVSILVYGEKHKSKDCSDMLVQTLRYPNCQIITCPATAKALNEAAESALGDYLLLVDADICNIAPDAVEQLLGYVLREDVAAAGAKVYDREQRNCATFLVMGIEHCFGMAFRSLEKDNCCAFMRSVVPQDVSGLPAVCTMYKKSVFTEVGGFDKELDLTYGAADLSLKIDKRGEEGAAAGGDGVTAPYRNRYKQVYVPYAYAQTDTLTEEYWHTDSGDAQITARWTGLAQKEDKYYNKNLTRRDTNFAIISSMELKNEDL